MQMHKMWQQNFMVNYIHYLYHSSKNNIINEMLIAQIAVYLESAFGFSAFIYRHILKKEALYKPLASDNPPFGGMVSIS